jgi:hypothetical protein
MFECFKSVSFSVSVRAKVSSQVKQNRTTKYKRFTSIFGEFMFWLGESFKFSFKFNWLPLLLGFWFDVKIHLDIKKNEIIKQCHFNIEIKFKLKLTKINNFQTFSFIFNKSKQKMRKLWFRLDFNDNIYK